MPRDVRRPEFFHGYVALDPGVVNRTFLLFGYHDFGRDVTVVERERTVRGIDASTASIADEINGAELDMWGPQRFAGGHQQPFRRVSDTDLRLIMDLARDHQLRFEKADKKQAGPIAGVKLIRDMAKLKQLEIDESCVVLLQQMRDAIWNKNATDFAVEEDGGHYDGIAALKYFVRAVRRSMSPLPDGWRATPVPGNTWMPQAEHGEEAKFALGPDTDYARRVLEEQGQGADEERPWYITP